MLGNYILTNLNPRRISASLWLSLGNLWIHLLQSVWEQKFVAKTGHFLEKEFLSKELSGRKIDIDEVTDQSLQLEETATKIVLEPSSTVGAEENGQNDIHDDHDIDDDHDEN